MLEKEFEYYVTHQDELVKLYAGKFIVIKNEKVIGVYNSEIDAYTDMVTKEDAGTFLIQECQPGNETYTQTFRTRVVF